MRTGLALALGIPTFLLLSCASSQPDPDPEPPAAAAVAQPDPQPPAAVAQLDPEPPAAVARPVDEPDPEQAQACAAQGGQWNRFGLAGTWDCNLPTADAGKACAGSDQCQSDCVAPGHCFQWTIMVGTCLSRVENGVVGPMLCLD